MADVNKTILLEYDVKTGKLVDENGRVIKSLDDLSNAYKRNKKAQDDSNRATEETKKRLKELEKLQQNQARSAGLAGAATFELGRTISDLPFGIVAVTNNISQLGTLMAALVANAGSVRKALGLLIGQLMGPAGVLVAFQLVTAAVTFFAQQNNKAKEATEEFSASAILTNNVLEGLRDIFLDTNEQLERRIYLLKVLAQGDEALQSILDKQMTSQEQQVRIAEDYIKSLREVEAQERRIREQKEEAEKLNEDFIISETEIQKRLEKTNALREQLSKTGLEAAINVLRDAFIRLLITDIEKENEVIEKQITILGDLSGEMTRVLTEKEALAEAAKIPANLLLISEEDAEEQKKLADDNQKIIENFRGKLLEIAAKSEMELLKVQRQAAIDRVKEGENSRQAIIAINKFFDEKEKIARAEIEAEKADTQKKNLADELRRLESQLKEKERIVAKELSLLKNFVREEQSLVFLRREVDAIETGDDTNFRNFKLRFYEIMMNDQELSEADRLAAKKQYLLLKKEIDDEEIKSDEELALKKQQQFEYLIGLTKQAFSSIMELTMAQAQAEADIEEAKTNKQNDELRRRLANEELSAKQRDKINQEIARNEAALVEKQNKINKRQFEQQKAANIAIATIDTYVAANQALKNPLELGPVAKFASVALVIAAGLANVAAIAKQQFVPKALPSPSLSALSGGTESSGPSFNVVGQSTRNQVAEAVGLALADQPLRAYVVSTDVTTAQELDRKIVEGASI